jgi:hypothetical protein
LWAALRSAARQPTAQRRIVRSFILSGAPASSQLILLAAASTKQDENENPPLWVETGLCPLRARV